MSTQIHTFDTPTPTQYVDPIFICDIAKPTKGLNPLISFPFLFLLHLHVHLSIRSSGNPFPQKASLFYVDVGSIPAIPKTHVCEFRLEFLSYIKKKRKKITTWRVNH